MGRSHYQGCELEKTAVERPRWFCRYTVPDTEGGRTPKREYFGFCDEIGVRAAKKLRDAFRKDLNETKKVLTGQIRLNRLLAAYRETIFPALSMNTRASYESAFKVHLEPTMGNLMLCEITNHRIQSWVNGLATTLTEATVKRTLSTLSSVIEQASDWGHFDGRNPCRRIRIPECVESEVNTRALTPDEVARLLGVVDMAEPPLANIVRVGIYCGLRIGETLALRWMDYEPPVLHVRRSRSQYNGVTKGPKSRKGLRTLPLGPIALQRPTDAKDSDRIFEVEYREASRALKKAMTSAGIKIFGTSTHLLRRTHMTLMTKMGAKNMREQLGHSSDAMALHYYRESFDDHQAKVMLIAELIMGDTAGRKM